MDFFSWINRFVDTTLLNERFGANAIAVGVMLAVTIVSWMIIRRLLAWGGPAKKLTGLAPLDMAIEFAIRQLKTLVGWLTFAAATGSVMIGFAYHLAGRNIERDFTTWYERLSWQQMESFGWIIGQLLVLALAARLAVALVARIRPWLEGRVGRWFKVGPAVEIVPRWFRLLERYALAMTVLAAVWAGCRLLAFAVAEPATMFVGRVVSIIVLARLLSMACRALSAPLADAGERKLRATPLAHYWDRLGRLFPLGERCCEAAIYVSAATLCVRELDFIAFVAGYGPRIVECIGIFFGTRVVIELLHVLLDELLGVGRDRPVDARRQTLAPLLHSGCRYLLYFGAAVMMLRAFEVDTTPILAGAGIIGLAGGLGAQSLVTDLVSGLFILFESQYLVGDLVEIGGAKGVVEAIAVRHTEIRDEQGKLHIIPNGQIKQVVNHSKDYVNAVINVPVPLSESPDAVIRAMREAGRRLRAARSEVLAETVIQGPAELTATEMTIRAITRVRPGTQVTIEYEYRRHLTSLLAASAPCPSELKAA